MAEEGFPFIAPPRDIRCVEVVDGNLFRRKWMGLPKGHMIPGHEHNFDHLTVIFRGAVFIEAELPDGRKFQKEFYAPCDVLIRADVKHKIIVLEEGTEFWCMYSHRDAKTGEVVMDYNGWRKAYE